MRPPLLARLAFSVMPPSALDALLAELKVMPNWPADEVMALLTVMLRSARNVSVALPPLDLVMALDTVMSPLPEAVAP